MDTFVTQMDGCNYLVDGRPSQGKNCTCAAEAMWLFRASRGKIKTTSCAVRMRTGDREGGNHLGQMEAVSKQFGITEGRVYRPILGSTLIALLETGRYGTHWNMSYEAFVGTAYDAQGGRFRGNHDLYVSGMGTAKGTLRVADPIRKHGYQDIPIPLMLKAAGMLDFGQEQLGAGKVYAYVTPADPLPPVNHHKARIAQATKLWNDVSQKWVWLQPAGLLLEVRGKGYPKGGTLCFPITDGPCAADAGTSDRAGYYIPTSTVKLEGQCT